MLHLVNTLVWYGDMDNHTGHEEKAGSLRDVGLSQTAQDILERQGQKRRGPAKNENHKIKTNINIQNSDQEAHLFRTYYSS